MPDFIYNHKTTSFRAQMLKVDAELKNIYSTRKHIKDTCFQFPFADVYIIVSKNSDQTVNLVKSGGDEYEFSYSNLGTQVASNLFKIEGKATGQQVSLDHVPSINGGIGQVLVGDSVQVGFYDSSRQKPYIRRIVKKGNLIIDPGGVVPPVYPSGQWYQSNASPKQNALGDYVNSNLLDPRNETINWHLPTSTNPEIENVGLRAFGLARLEAPARTEFGELIESSPKVDCYMTAYPKSNESGSFGVWIGAWTVGTNILLWETSSGSGPGWTNPSYPLHSRFFVDPLTGWAHAVERPTNVSPQKINSACALNKFNGSDISRAATGGANLASISFNSFMVTTGEGAEAVTNPEAYFFCPAHPAISTTGLASVDFLQMNQSNGHWDSYSSYDPGLIPDGGPSVIPDLISYGFETGGPPPWLGKEALMFVSGGVKEIFGGTTWSKAHWTLRSIKVNGTPGSLVVSKTLNPVNNPTILSQASLKTQVAAVDHTILEWITSFPFSLGFWRGGLRINNDTSDSTWQIFSNAPPILLPYSGPNFNRVGTLVSRLASVWPPEKKNCGGGVVVDLDAENADHIAFCVLEPEQIVYAKGYAPTPAPSYEDPNLEEVTDQLQTYQYHYREYNPCEGRTLEADGYRTDTTVPHGSQPSVAPGSPYSDTVPCFNVEYGSGTVIRNYFVDDEGLHKQIYNTWIQQVGTIYRTKLIVVAPDGTKREKDISQLLDATHSSVARGSTNYVGLGGPVTITGTESNFPLAHNVWQIILLKQKDLVVLLRDLHLDGANNNPTPNLEVWDISGPIFTKLSTVRLGSYTEKMLVDNNPQGWRAGDQLWNPYAFQGPRMKGCLDVDGIPHILVMVGEGKKVTSSQSGFKRVCYSRISLEDPTAPTVLNHAITSPDVGIGNSGDVPTDWPLWWEWDSLILTKDRVTWIKDSKFRESIPTL